MSILFDVTVHYLFDPCSACLNSYDLVNIHSFNLNPFEFATSHSLHVYIILLYR